MVFFNDTTLDGIADYQKKVEIVVSDYEEKQRDLLKVQMKKDSVLNAIEIQEITSSILIQSSTAMRDTAKTHLEKIVTDALQFMTQDTSYKFIIEIDTSKSKPSAEFFIESITDGNLTKLKPEDSCGGGFIDVINVTLKVAYLVIFKEPKIMNATLLLDEPNKMVSEQMSIKFAEYIKFLGKQFGLRIIMITHNDNLSNVADETFVVMKNRSGISNVSNVVNLNSNDIDNILNMELQEES